MQQDMPSSGQKFQRDLINLREISNKLNSWAALEETIVMSAKCLSCSANAPVIFNHTWASCRFAKLFTRLRASWMAHWQATSFLHASQQEIQANKTTVLSKYHKPCAKIWKIYRYPNLCTHLICAIHSLGLRLKHRLIFPLLHKDLRTTTFWNRDKWFSSLSFIKHVWKVCNQQYCMYITEGFICKKNSFSTSHKQVCMRQECKLQYSTEINVGSKWVTAGT